MYIKFFVFMLAACSMAAEPMTLVDFTKSGHGWKGNSRTRIMTEDGAFTVELTGDDPWVEGPQRALPAPEKAEKLRVTLNAVCTSTGSCQLFYAVPGGNFSADNTVDLIQLPGSQSTYQGIIPLTSPSLRFRIDPPGSSGSFSMRSLQATPLIPMAAPTLGKPAPVVLSDKALTIEAGPLRLAHNAAQWNSFACFINGRKMAEANPAETLAYWDGSQVITVALKTAQTTVHQTARGFTIQIKIRDAGDAVWLMKRKFSINHGALQIETSLEVSEPREVIHLPWLTLFAGVGSFGESKSQALLPGVEYLENEPSSNEKEIKGAAANRRIVDGYKVCYPMMTLAADGNWFSVEWQKGTLPASPVFDSPDRLYNSGGHVLGLWSPAVGDARFEGETVVYDSIRLAKGKTYSCTTTLCGGKGDVVTEAVGSYAARIGLPPLPVYAPGFAGAIQLLAAGWLDSAARHGNKWQHAVWGTSFAPSLAEDVPAYLLWLAVYTQDATLKARLLQCAHEVIAVLPKGSPGINGISHVKRLTGALLYGNLEHLVAQAAPQAKKRAATLAAQGGVTRYTPAEDKPDYASTLGSDHCNGFTAMTLEGVMQDAVLTGDESAIASALSALDQLTKHYAGQVPRGAQPWEMPLHTPDIVAAARLVRCYVLGYQLSDRADYLEQARYWAWTGVSMVYLTPPTEGEVGLYATIGVIGATNWSKPNWIGQPVQWCGLVYRSALVDLARVDQTQGELWKQLADGITLAGLQMCFPVDDPDQRGGLLPDYFHLKAQVSDGPAINPGTLQAHLAEAYDKTPMSTLTRLSNGMLVHAPGDVKQQPSAAESINLSITAWPEKEYRILITRIAKAPAQMTWNGAEVTPRFLEDAHSMIITLKGSGTLKIEVREF